MLMLVLTGAVCAVVGFVLGRKSTVLPILKPSAETWAKWQVVR